ncbi:hypothetical protein [Devosia sp.]|uniref:hypothetical protein n=1 Tax=Devosia sp. TaxID=1871048 RepID=UPI002AFDD445|nr:hypothetical protein [Devosia sp.]
MPLRSGILIRELGTALAVVALYVLVLLAPLHQAAGLQRDLTRLGYISLANWSVCAQPTTLGGDLDLPIIVKCAAAGIASNALPPASPAVLAIAPLRLASPIVYGGARLVVPPALPPHQGQSRAPPVTV